MLAVISVTLMALPVFMDDSALFLLPPSVSISSSSSSSSSLLNLHATCIRKPPVNPLHSRHTHHAGPCIFALDTEVCLPRIARCDLQPLQPPPRMPVHCCQHFCGCSSHGFSALLPLSPVALLTSPPPHQSAFRLPCASSRGGPCCRRSEPAE